MADDDMDDGLGDDEVSGGSSQKKSGGGGFLPSLLKYVALALGAIILIVTVVIITMKVMGGNKPAAAAIPISEDYKEIAEELDWYQGIGEIQTRSSDPIPASVVVNIFLGYKRKTRLLPPKLRRRESRFATFCEIISQERRPKHFLRATRKNLRLKFATK